MQYQLLKELLPYLEAFEAVKKNDSDSLEDFIEWLINERKGDKIQSVEKYYRSPSMDLQGNLNAQITQLLALMNKYLRFYLKKGFEGTVLSGPDDFGFLATLFLEGDLQKNELIEKNTMEFSSGMEVIKRLEKNKLIESLPDNKDKRAKIVQLTEEGKGVLVSIMPLMTQIAQIAMANLNNTEREQLLEILNKLNHFHNPIFHQSKKDSIEEILSTNLKY